MTTRRAGWLALVCSFGVYFIPLLGPHVGALVGELIWQQFRRLENPAWAWSSLAVTLAFQAAAFLILYWFWRRRGVLSVLALLTCGFGSIFLAQFVYMLWLPAFFMIEREASPEAGSWPEACSVPDASVMTFRTPRRIPDEGWREAWISDSQSRQWVLRMPDCQKIPAPLPQAHMEPGGRVDFSIGISQVIPDARALVQRQEVSTGKITWHLLNAAAGTLTPLPSPETDKFVAPYLSNDGSRTAWIVPVPGSGPPMLDVLHVLPVEAGGRETLIDLSTFGPASYETVGLDPSTGEVLFWVSGPRKLLATGLDGQPRPAPAMPAGVEPQSQTLVVTRHGVLAWDAYKEDDGYLIAWAMDAGTGSRRIPKGSGINAATLDPSGRYVAVSTTTTLSIGSVRDSVFVFRTSDGTEVFRRFLPKYSRSNVVFLGQDHFVYSDANRVHVVSVPGMIGRAADGRAGDRARAQ